MAEKIIDGDIMNNELAYADALDGAKNRNAVVCVDPENPLENVLIRKDGDNTFCFGSALNFGWVLDNLFFFGLSSNSLSLSSCVSTIRLRFFLLDWSIIFPFCFERKRCLLLSRLSAFSFL